jgi:glutamate-1-semialdehyde 2,1-aminomutase
MTIQPVLRNTPDLDAALTEARQHFLARHPQAQALHGKANAYLPGGNTRTVLYHGPVPIRVVRAEGARLFDADGHSYLDLLGEYSAGLFGHSHPAIRTALSRAAEAGLSFGAHGVDEIELAALITSRFASIERVRFTNSGTEANMMALALARVATGRQAIAVASGAYHGGVLYFAGGGSPVNMPGEVVLIPFNETEAARDILRAQGPRLAAILIEPMLGSGGCLPAHAAYIAMLREEATRAGALLVLDEVMTSRTGAGGAQALFGVTPDLTTLGKYMGGGMSFGAFGGRAELMDLFDPARPGALPHAGTFNNNVMTMAAGIVAMRDLFPPQVAQAHTARGEAFRARLNALFAQLGVGWCASGLGSLMTLHPLRQMPTRPADLAAADDRLRELLFLDLLEAGVYLARRGYIALSLALTEADLDLAVSAIGAALERRLALHAA